MQLGGSVYEQLRAIAERGSISRGTEHCSTHRLLYPHLRVSPPLRPAFTSCFFMGAPNLKSLPEIPPNCAAGGDLLCSQLGMPYEY